MPWGITPSVINEKRVSRSHPLSECRPPEPEPAALSYPSTKWMVQHRRAWHNGWAAALIVPVVMGFNKSIVDFPSKKRRSLDGLAAQSPNARQPGAIAGYEKAATG
jgi:hypothetical protein